MWGNTELASMDKVQLLPTSEAALWCQHTTQPLDSGTVQTKRNVALARECAFARASIVAN